MAGMSPATALTMFTIVMGLTINASDFTLANRIGNKDVPAGQLAFSIIIPAVALIGTAYWITGTGVGSTQP